MKKNVFIVYLVALALCAGTTAITAVCDMWRSISVSLAGSESVGELASFTEIMRFGDENAHVFVEENWEAGGSMTAVLKTPEDEYMVYGADGSFILPPKGSYWLELAFMLGAPELAQSFRKAADYKRYDDGAARYAYIAVYTYDTQALMDAMRKEIPDGLLELRDGRW